MGGSSAPSPRVQQVPSTTTQTNEPWAQAIPGLEKVLSEAGLAYGQAKTWPKFQTFTEFDPLQLESFDRMTARARAGSPQIPAAQAFNLAAIEGQPNQIIPLMQATARGDFLTGPNPYLEQALDPAYDKVLGQFGAAGRLGSTYNKDQMIKAAAPFLLGEYGRERGLQESAKTQLANIYQQDLMNQQFAAGQAGIMADWDFADDRILGGIGAFKRQQDEMKLAQRIQEFNFIQNEQDARLARYAALVGNVSGRGGTSTQVGTQPIVSQGQPGFGWRDALGVAATAASFMCDHRLKDNIEDLPDGALDNVLKLKPKTYNYRPEYGFDPTPTKGFLAHEVQEVLPEAVTGIKDGELPQLIDVISILTTVTKALQELAVKVNELEATVQEIKHGS